MGKATFSQAGAVGNSDAEGAETRQGRYLTDKEAAAYLALSTAQLQRYRSEGGGPKFYRFGIGPKGRGRIRYLKADLDEWVGAPKSNIHE